MHITKVLQNYLKESVADIHQKRLSCLLQTSATLLSRAKLTLTSLGHHRQGQAHVKHKIKAVDRLLKNNHLYAERIKIYQAIAAKLIGHLKMIDIIIDWSPVSNRTYYILRASLVFEQRSITLYEEVHPEEKLGNYVVHKSFLTTLRQIIPSYTKPVIITDSGFRTEWFELVLSQGWDFEGRVCNNMQYLLDNHGTWKKTKVLKPVKMNKATYIGKVLLTKVRQLPCEMYAYLGKRKNNTISHSVRKKGRKRNSPRANRRYRNQHTQPWILVTSIQYKNKLDAKAIVKRYARRMKIEHEFRTTKNAKWGLGLNQTLTCGKLRLEILLLIGTIAMLYLWLIGLASERRNLQYHYQVNTIKTRRVLSILFLGLQVIEHQPNLITFPELNTVLRHTQFEEENTYF